MAIRDIRVYPDTALRRISSPVSFRPDTKDTLAELVLDMRDTLKAESNGAALAANQIGDESRVFLLSAALAEQWRIPEVIANPRMFKNGDETCVELEGCLSFPGVHIPVTRWLDISVRFNDVDGRTATVHLGGFMSRVFQHEMDHLDGKLFHDGLSEHQARQVERIVEKKGRSVARTA